MNKLAGMSGGQMLLALLIALIAWTAVMVGHWVRERDAAAQERGRVRDATFESLRWATELATSSDPAKVAAGLAALTALASRNGLDPAGRSVAGSVVQALDCDPATTPRAVA